jgi:hypothetical protein
MLDWDVPNEGHLTKDAITLNSRYEAVNLLQKLCQQNASWRWRVYKTPGGVRAFCMSHQWDINKPTEAAVARMLMEHLKCDPCYTHFTFTKNEGWAARVSKKPARQGDYIAQYLFDIGEGEALSTNTTNIVIHDALVAKYATVKHRATPKPILKAKA